MDGRHALPHPNAGAGSHGNESTTSHHGSSRKHGRRSAVPPTTLRRLASDPPRQRFLHSLGRFLPVSPRPQSNGTFIVLDGSCLLPILRSPVSTVPVVKTNRVRKKTTTCENSPTALIVLRHLHLSKSSGRPPADSCLSRAPPRRARTEPAAPRGVRGACRPRVSRSRERGACG